MPRYTISALALAAAAATLRAQEEPPERMLGGVLVATSEQVESPLVVFRVSADGRRKLEYTEKHLLSIDPIARVLGLEPPPSEVTEGLHRLELQEPILSPKGDYVVGRVGDAFDVHDAMSGERLARHGDVGAIRCAAVYDEDTLLLGAEDGKLHLRELRTGELIEAYEAHTAPVTWIGGAYVAGRTPQMLFVAGAEDKSLKIWDFAARTEKVALQLDHVPRHVAFDSKVETLITAGEQDVQIWDLKRGRRKKTFKLDAAPTCVAITADGKRFAAGTADGQVAFGKVSNSRPQALWPSHPGGALLAVCFVDDGRREILITAGLRSDVCYWDAEKLPQELGGRRRR